MADTYFKVLLKLNYYFNTSNFMINMELKSPIKLLVRIKAKISSLYNSVQLIHQIFLRARWSLVPFTVPSGLVEIVDWFATYLFEKWFDQCIWIHFTFFIFCFLLLPLFFFFLKSILTSWSVVSRTKSVLSQKILILSHSMNDTLF